MLLNLFLKFHQLNLNVFSVRFQGTENLKRNAEETQTEDRGFLMKKKQKIGIE